MLWGTRWLWESPPHPQWWARCRDSLGCGFTPAQVPALCLCHGEVCWARFLLLMCFSIFVLSEFGARPSLCSFFSPVFPVYISRTYFAGISVPSRWTCFPLFNADLSPPASPLTFLQSHMGRVFCSALCCKSCVGVAAIIQESFESQHHFCLTPCLAVVIIIQS